jgi:hypothetical protein
MDAEQDCYPVVSEIYARVTALTPAQCRDALAYLIGFTPLGVNLAISQIRAQALDQHTEAGG